MITGMEAARLFHHRYVCISDRFCSFLFMQHQSTTNVASWQLTYRGGPSRTDRIINWRETRHSHKATGWPLCFHQTSAEWFTRRCRRVSQSMWKMLHIFKQRWVSWRLVVLEWVIPPSVSTTAHTCYFGNFISSDFIKLTSTADSKQISKLVITWDTCLGYEVSYIGIHLLWTTA